MFTFYSLLNLSLGNDIAPTSYFQSIFASLLCMLGSFAIAGFFGNIAFIIDSINEKSNEKAYNLETLNAKLTYRKIPSQFSIMALEYAAFMHEKKKFLSTLDCVKDLSL